MITNERVEAICDKLLVIGFHAHALGGKVAGITVDGNLFYALLHNTRHREGVVHNPDGSFELFGIRIAMEDPR